MHRFNILIWITLVWMLMGCGPPITTGPGPDEDPVRNAVEVIIELDGAEFVENQAVYDEVELGLSYATLRIGVLRFEGDGPEGFVAKVVPSSTRFELVASSVMPSPPSVELDVGNYSNVLFLAQLEGDESNPAVEVHGVLDETPFVLRSAMQQLFKARADSLILQSGRDVTVRFGLNLGPLFGDLDLDDAEMDDDGTVYIDSQHNQELLEELENHFGDKVEDEIPGEEEDKPEE